ncbi:hypothetical protein M422DRAFT_66413 [Sphaerobolus stellatus SS14]|nr:hypothetical protein M422DRAFT_66413 [Sphaerobolus stellatus SS14]
MGAVLLKINENNDPSKELKFIFNFCQVQENNDEPESELDQSSQENVFVKSTENVSTADVISGRPAKAHRAIVLLPARHHRHTSTSKAKKRSQSPPINLGPQVAGPSCLSANQVLESDSSRFTTPESVIEAIPVTSDRPVKIRRIIHAALLPDITSKIHKRSQSPQINLGSPEVAGPFGLSVIHEVGSASRTTTPESVIEVMSPAAAREADRKELVEFIDQHNSAVLKLFDDETSKTPSMRAKRKRARNYE